MPKYRALRTTLLGHESRVVQEGEEFSTTFPEGMKLSDNLELVEDEAPAPAPKGKGKGSTPPADE